MQLGRVVEHGLTDQLFHDPHHPYTQRLVARPGGEAAVTQASPVLSIRGLRKSFTLHTIDGRTVTSLRGVDLDVHAGEHVALAGASGAGKSSLLRCVHRSYLPDAGSVRLRVGGTSGTAAGTASSSPGWRTGRWPARGREFGYVTQFLAAPPRTGPLEVVAGAARRRGWTGRPRWTPPPSTAPAEPGGGAVGRGLLAALRRRAAARQPGGRHRQPTEVAAAGRAVLGARPGQPGGGCRPGGIAGRPGGRGARGVPRPGRDAAAGVARGAAAGRPDRPRGHPDQMAEALR